MIKTVTHFMNERFICFYVDKNNCRVCNGSNKSVNRLLINQIKKI